MSLEGKVYAITGGASGIGLATAKLVSSRGGIACIADINAEGLERVKGFFNNSGTPHQIRNVDVSKRDQVEAWLKGIVDEYGRLDGAANIAGVIAQDLTKRTLVELEDDEWDRIIAVNLTGIMYCMRAELKLIEEGGSIVNMASIHSLKGMEGHGAYAASKHGVLGLTRVAAQENGAREVRINAVAPGSILTPMVQKAWDKLGIPHDAPFDEPTAFRRQGSAEEVAKVVGFLLGPDSTFVSGACYSVDGSWH